MKPGDMVFVEHDPHHRQRCMPVLGRVTDIRVRTAHPNNDTIYVEGMGTEALPYSEGNLAVATAHELQRRAADLMERARNFIHMAETLEKKEEEESGTKD